MNPAIRNDWDPLAKLSGKLRTQLQRFSYRRWIPSNNDIGEKKSSYETILFLWLRDDRIYIFHETQPAVKAICHPTLTFHKVTELVYGSQHYLTLNSQGKILSWGENGQGQLGLGHRDRVRCPKIVPFDQKVRMIKAGESFSMLLTVEARVYVWGRLVVPSGPVGSINDQQLFRRPKLMTDLFFVRQIAAGKVHALALNAQGFVYAWGSNACGQLGRADLKEMIFEPEKILFEFRCKAIAAGDDFSLLLTINGMVYQMGFFCQKDQERASTKGISILPIYLDKSAVAIEAHEDLAIIQTVSGRCHILQRDLKSRSRLPIKILFNSIDETLAYFRPYRSAKVQTYDAQRHIKFYGYQEQKPYCVWEEMIDRPEVSDMIFLVAEDGGQTMNAQQALLRQRSAILDQLFELNCLSSPCPSVFSINSYRMQTVAFFVRYLYLSEWPQQVDEALKALPVTLIVELYHLAGEYLEEALLKKCKEYMSQHINGNNCQPIIHFAKESNMHWLEQMALKYIDGNDGGNGKQTFNEAHQPEEKNIDEKNEEVKEKSAFSFIGIKTKTSHEESSEAVKKMKII